MRKTIFILTSLIMLLLIVACTDANTPDTSTDVLLSVEINPAFEILVGSDDKVKSYQLKNEDAEILAAGLDLVGMNYEDALKLMLNQAIDTGYIDVERSDQAVALMAANGDADKENQFRETVQTKLQTFFQENAIGAVVLNHGELDEEVISFSEEHEISIGLAKLTLAYLEANLDVTLEDALALSPNDLATAIRTYHQAEVSEFKAQREQEALEVKNELKSMVQERVQAHKDAVLSGTKTQPDLTGVAETYQNQYQTMKAAYEERNLQRKNQAKAKLSLNVPRMVSLDINPQVDFVIDANGLVYSVMFKNEDAEIVGAGLDLVGLTYQQAFQHYVDAAVDTGYISVTRADNAVALMTGSLDAELDETFQNQIKTMLQTYFQENALGAVVLSKADVDETLQNVMDTYDISAGYAKLALAYQELYPEMVLDNIVLLEPSDLIDDIAALQVSAYAQYKSEKEANALMIKNEMKIAMQAEVQAHKDAVTAGTKTQPDLTGVEEAYLLQYQTKIQEFTDANTARKDAAKDKVQQGQGQVLFVDINPSVEMVIDPNGFVTSVKFKNEDAEIVGAGLMLVGAHYEDALNQYLQAAIQTGYIDVERNDNAVCVQTAHMNEATETAFQAQVETKLQTFFQENAIGAVVLKHGEIDEEVMNLVDTYDLSVGHAKLILGYLEANPEVTLEEALLLPIEQLVLNTIHAHEAYMNAYKGEKETSSQAIKDEMTQMMMSKVKAHEQAVQNGTKEAPDTTGVREAYLANYELMHQGYVTRNQERKETAKQQAGQNQPA